MMEANLIFAFKTLTIYFIVYQKISYMVAPAREIARLEDGTKAEEPSLES